MTVEELYTNIGGDYNNVRLRLPDDSTIAYFLKWFASEGSYNALITAVKNHDRKASFKAAHDLKGMSANMAFTELWAKLEQLTEQLRPCDTDADPELLEQVKDCYLKIVNEISLFEDKK